MAESDPIYINIRNYKLNFDEIGRGAFGNVYHGINTDTNEVVAAKKVKYKDGGQSINEVLSEMGQREGEILSRLNGHRNIVKLLDYFDDKSSYWFIMEFCSLNDLPKYMKNQAIDIDVNAKVRIMVDVASGLAFMHGMTPPVIHRDVKAENILMKQEGKRHIAKISDFGMGKLFEADTNHFTMTSGVGTMGYMAPEFFVDGEYLRYQPGVDTFALGLLFSVILLYEREHNDMKPMSVQSRTSGMFMNYGFEMKNAFNSKTPMPRLFKQGGERNPCVEKLTEEMTQFQDRDRPSLQQVKTQVLESYYELTQSDDIKPGYNLKSQNESLKRKIQGLESELESVKRGRGKIEERMNRYRDERNLANQRIQNLEVDNNRYREEIDTTRQEIHQIQMDNNRYRNERDAARQEINQIQADNNRKVTQLEHDRSEFEKRCQELQRSKEDMATRLAQEMVSKLAADESSVENVSIKNRPMNIADDYNLLCSNEWLDAKTAVDEKMYQMDVLEQHKLQMLHHILLVAYAEADDVIGTIGPDVVHLDGIVQHVHRKLDEESQSFTATSPVKGKKGDSPAQSEYMKLWPYVNKESYVMHYIVKAVKLAWKMVIQRPKMNFAPAETEWKGVEYQDVYWGSYWGSDMTAKKPLVYEVFPRVCHGEKAMSKAKVYLVKPKATK